MSSQSTNAFCGQSPEVVNLRISSTKVSGKDHYVIIHESKLWTNRSNISFSFLGGTDYQKGVVSAAIAQYTRYANVSFTPVKDNDPSAEIRIAFDGLQAWCAVGMDALGLPNPQPTMNLGIIGSYNSSQADRSIALHEIGHAFGLAHEGNGKTGNVLSNFPHNDNTSIMTFIQDEKGIPVNAELSRSDIAWLILSYPGKFVESDGKKWTSLRSLNVLQVPADVASRILLTRNVSEKRFHYSQYISSRWGNQQASHPGMPEEISNLVVNHFSNLGTPTEQTAVKQARVTSRNSFETEEDIDPDVCDAISSVILHPQFREIVTTLAVKDAPQHFVNLTYYQTTDTSADIQQGILGILGPLAMKLVGGLVSNDIAQQGIQAGPLPDNVQQGIFKQITSFAKNPAFRKIVGDIVTQVVNTTAAAGAGA